MSKRVYRAERARNRRAFLIENPRVRSIRDLLNCRFYIPRYQRGFRWGKHEITDLLNDILHYHQTLKLSNPFYCLQPIVVKKKSWTGDDEKKVNGWEVIDGQQRLTTILLILHYLESTVPESISEKLGDTINFYTLDFETRVDCKYFLQNRSYTREIVDTNADFYHLSKAYQYIREWFAQDEVKAIANIEAIFLNTLLDAENSVSVIWYEHNSQQRGKHSDKDDSAINLFTRLNEKKVPFTSSELIKALLLQSDFYPASEKRFVRQRLSEIASEWTEIEAKLRDERMWCFINDDLSYHPTSRIELIIRILTQKWSESENETLEKCHPQDERPQYSDYFIFRKHLLNIRISFRNNLSDQSNVMDPINEIWGEVKSLFVTLEEWYNNHQLFHYIGYLFAIHTGCKKELLKNLTELELDKDDFLHHIKTSIAQEIILSKNLIDLRYDEAEDRQAITHLLLLMDIEAMARQECESFRFPFHLYKRKKINHITHINPQTPPPIDTNKAEAHAWLHQHQQSLMALKSDGFTNSGKEIDHLLFQIDCLLNKFNAKKYAEVFAQSIELSNKLSNMKEDEAHALSNLMLMDRNSHTQINNSFFVIKHDQLKANTNGKYIPINSQRVLTKYYSERPREIIFWNTEDRQNYLSAINTVYGSYNQLLSKHNAK